MQINFNDLQKQYLLLKKDIDNSIYKVLEDSKFIQGPEVKQLEEDLSKYTYQSLCNMLLSVGI